MTIYAVRDTRSGLFLDALARPLPGGHAAEAYCRADRGFFDLMVAQPRHFGRTAAEAAGWEVVAFTQLPPYPEGTPCSSPAPATPS